MPREHGPRLQPAPPGSTDPDIETLESLLGTHRGRWREMRSAHRAPPPPVPRPMGRLPAMAALAATLAVAAVAVLVVVSRPAPAPDGLVAARQDVPLSLRPRRPAGAQRIVAVSPRPALKGVPTIRTPRMPSRPQQTSVERPAGGRS